MNRFRLRDSLLGKIRHLRRTAAKEAYDQMLLPGCETPLEVSRDLTWNYPPQEYPARALYEGQISYRKHYYEVPAAMNQEEAACAAFIDALASVEYWVRNLERDQFAFWLQTSTDKFYPDFVAKLTDGRFLAVEYKGSLLETTDDTAEKDMIGHLWEARSNGLCLFRLVTKETMNEDILGGVRGGA